MGEDDPGSLGAATRLRKDFDADVAAWALTQAELRRRGRAKFPDAERMLFTRTGLEQATRQAVAAWRAQQMAASGVTEVVDLGCGLGADALAMARAGMAVIAVDADEETARCARHNLSGVAEVMHARAEDVTLPQGAAVFLDPARRGERGRSWDVADLSPSWEFVTRQLGGDRFTVVKLGPGFPKNVIPDGVGATWVSHGRDVVELSLWNRARTGVSVVSISPAGDTSELTSTSPAEQLGVGEVGSHLSEPDGAVIRAGLLDHLVPDVERWRVDAGVAYLASNQPLHSPFLTCFEVHDVLPHDEKVLRGWVRDHHVGTLEIKVRGMDVDPAVLRRRLKPRGKEAATLVLTPTPDGARALVVTRV